jgi:O-antigen ligase
MTLVLALPMAWFLASTSQRPLVRWICRSYLPVGLFSIALTASRGGMLAAFVALLIVPLTMTKLSPGRLAGAIGMLGLAGVLAVMYVPDKVVERLASTGSSVQGLSLGGRFRLWVAGFHVFTQKPVFGWGTGTYKLAITPEMGANAQVAHSSFMSLLVEQGAIGFFIYMVMLLAIFRAVLTLPSFERRLGLTLYATLIVSMLPLTWEHSKPAWVVMSLLVGMAATELRWPRPANPSPATPFRSMPRRDWRTARPVAPAGISPRNPRQDSSA